MYRLINVDGIYLSNMPGTCSISPSFFFKMSFFANFFSRSFSLGSSRSISADRNFTPESNPSIDEKCSFGSSDCGNRRPKSPAMVAGLPQNLVLVQTDRYSVSQPCSYSYCPSPWHSRHCPKTLAEMALVLLALRYLWS